MLDKKQSKKLRSRPNTKWRHNGRCGLSCMLRDGSADWRNAVRHTGNAVPTRRRRRRRLPTTSAPTAVNHHRKHAIVISYPPDPPPFKKKKFVKTSLSFSLFNGRRTHAMLTLISYVHLFYYGRPLVCASDPTIYIDRVYFIIVVLPFYVKIIIYLWNMNYVFEKSVKLLISFKKNILIYKKKRK